MRRRPLLLQANRHPDMKQLYDKYLTGLQAAGVQLITHFTHLGAYSKFGSWGLLEW
jgi:hypothetical protein